MKRNFRRSIAKILVLAVMSGLIFPYVDTTDSKAVSDSELSVENGTIQVDIADEADRDLTVSGVVTDEAGVATSGQAVTLQKQLLYHDEGQTKEKWFAYDTDETDEDGAYSIKAEKNTVYRISIGRDMPAHSEAVWARDKDITINLSRSIYSLEGRAQTEVGDGVSGVYITLKKISDSVGSDDALTDDGTSDTNTYSTDEYPVYDSFDTYGDYQNNTDSYEGDDTISQWDPVSESEDDDMLLPALTADDGSFKYDEISTGTYQLYMGRTGVLVSEFVIDKDDFTTVVISDSDAKIEEYRNQILADEDRAVDYGTELDLPGYLVPTPSPTPKPQETVRPNYEAVRLYDGEVIYSDYSYSMSEYAQKEYNSVPRVSLQRYMTLLDPQKDTTKGMKYLRIDEYRKVNEKEFTRLYQSMIESYCKSAGLSYDKSSLYGHAEDILDAAKKYEIDPVFLTTQTFHESAFGTSHLASGSTIDKVAREGYPRTAAGKFLTKKLDKKVRVYNLYGIKAYDADPYVGGTSFAYYSGWTTPKKAIYGAAKYLHDNYVHHPYYAQNTAFKIRFVNAMSIWHQYATGPTYAEDLGRRMISMAGVYSARAKFKYDYPRFKAETKTVKKDTIIKEK